MTVASDRDITPIILLDLLPMVTRDGTLRNNLAQAQRRIDALYTAALLDVARPAQPDDTLLGESLGGRSRALIEATALEHLTGRWSGPPGHGRVTIEELLRRAMTALAQAHTNEANSLATVDADP